MDPSPPRLAIPPYLNVGRFTAPTHHVYNLFLSPFLLFAYAAHCKITHHHELYSILLIRVFVTIGGRYTVLAFVLSQPLCAITLHECDYT